jgi:hypothetical protein
MASKKNLLVCLFIMTIGRVFAQQAYTVTDQQPQMIDGLNMGYNIKSLEEKNVSDKGLFSRYSIRFFVTNTSSEAKIMLYKQGWNIGNNVSDELVQFNCLNATGARLTSKSTILRADPCNVTALVDDNIPGTNKTKQNKRVVQIGYWIKPGQTISADAIMIVPLNQPLNMQAVYLANQLQYTASASMSTAPNGVPDISPQSPIRGGFSKIKNLFNNTYINVEAGPITSTAITGDWWSAQWLLIPVPGTNYVNIKNRWKQNFIGTERGYVVITPIFQTESSMWILEPGNGNNIFRIRNVQTNAYLCIATSNQLIAAVNTNNNLSSAWLVQ